VLGPNKYFQSSLFFHELLLALMTLEWSTSLYVKSIITCITKNLTGYRLKHCEPLHSIIY